MAAEVAETEIITVKEAERQRPRRWSRGRDQGLVIVAYALTAESLDNFFLGVPTQKKLKKKHGLNGLKWLKMHFLKTCFSSFFLSGTEE